jgi:hypothetical protein
MTAAIVRLLPADEKALLKAYVEGTSEPDNADAIYEALEVPADATPPRASARKDEIRRQLLDYCSLDTYALVRLWQYFTGRNDICI